MITKVGSKWVVKSGGKVLGEYDDEEAAKAKDALVTAFEKCDGSKCSSCGERCSSGECECEDCECAGCAAEDCGEGDEHGDSKMTRGVARIDKGELKSPVLMKNGYLKCDARLTRTGVFLYRNEDGSPRRELRLPEEVFRGDSIESFSMAPITDDHPPVFLTSKNTGEWQRGHMSEAVRADGKFVVGAMLVTDARLIEKMQKGKAVEVSCGYTCDLEERGGVTEDGEHYDAVQRNIVGNHVAIVPAGRAGPEARVRMDSRPDLLVSIESDGTTSAPKPVPPEASTVKKIKIDGVEYEAGSEQAVAAQLAFQTKLDAQAKELTEKEKAEEEEEKKKAAFLEKMKAKSDADDERIKKLDAENKALPGKVAAELKARMELETSAKSVLGSKAKLDALTDRDVKAAVLKKTNPDLKLDGKSDEYVNARFDMALEQAAEETEDGSETEDGIHAARRVVVDSDDADGEPGDPADEMTDAEANANHTDSATAHEAMMHRNRNAWKQPIGNEKPE